MKGTHHRDTEHTEGAQRKAETRKLLRKPGALSQPRGIPQNRPAPYGFAPRAQFFRTIFRREKLIFLAFFVASPFSSIPQEFLKSGSYPVPVHK
jgi:hypothetical protein